MGFVYNNGGKLLSESYWTTTTLKSAIVDATYVADRDHVFMSSVGNSEVTGSGYSRGFNSPSRHSLLNKTVVIDNTANAVNYKANDLTWSALSTGPFNAIVILQEVTTDADSLLIAYIDSATTVNPLGADVPALFQNGVVFNKTT